MGLSENSEKRALIGWPRSVSTTARAAVVSNGVMLSWSLDSSCITGTGRTSGLRHSTPQACLHVIGIPYQDDGNADLRRQYKAVQSRALGAQCPCTFSQSRQPNIREDRRWPVHA